MTGEPVVTLPQTVSNDELGGAVAKTLRGYKAGVPHPNLDELNKLTDPVLDASRLKSWSTFSRGALFCSISEEATTMRITPSRRTGSRGGCFFLPEREVVLGLPATPEQLGVAVREALSRCE